MNSAPGEIGENVKIARECSLLGNYETALIYYQGVVQQIHRHLQGITDSNLKEKWQEVSFRSQANLEINFDFFQFAGSTIDCSGI